MFTIDIVDARYQQEIRLREAGRMRLILSLRGSASPAAGLRRAFQVLLAALLIG